ncbi:helix-turn-helix domain-containing protein [Ochrobactrum sp. EDr1-4]|uniref:HVO_A0114 family putative DNA-binding protein n=1 Tax=Ochrobactrum sp. EDr1-4 TaxID=3368622 RepID=UPI003B9FB72D
MNTLNVRIASHADTKSRVLRAAQQARTGEAVAVDPSLNFLSYDDMHRVLAPSRLAIVKALAGQGALSIREVARRVGRDVQAVHRDVTTLINAGVIDKREQGISFPYERINFDFDVSVAT